MPLSFSVLELRAFRAGQMVREALERFCKSVGGLRNTPLKGVAHKRAAAVIHARRTRSGAPGACVSPRDTCLCRRAMTDLGRDARTKPSRCEPLRGRASRNRGFRIIMPAANPLQIDLFQ
jgi:hypothetical protein